MSWCSALAFHFLLSKERGLTIAASKDSADESFRVWEQTEGESGSVKSRINNAMFSFVRDLFSNNLLLKPEQHEDKQPSNSKGCDRLPTCHPPAHFSLELFSRLLQDKNEAELVTDLKVLMGANFKETFLGLYASTSWMTMVAYFWGTSFPQLAEEERCLLDKAWSSPQVTAECRQKFTNFGNEALTALLTEESEPPRQPTELSYNPQLSLLDEHQSLVFPDYFSLEYTPSISRLSETGQEWEVEEIVARRLIGNDRRKDDNYEYLIKWKGYGHEDNTWEKFEHLHCRELIVQLKRKERWLRQRNIRMLLEEGILQFGRFPQSHEMSNETLLEVSHGDAVPLRLEFSLTEDAQNSRTTY